MKPKIKFVRPEKPNARGIYYGAHTNLEKERRNMGLDKIVSGKRNCLRCDRIFDSDCVKTNRLCLSCKKTIDLHLS